MNNDKISIVVPIYKTEKYLEKCIESIVNQTYKNLEIILVNDGSPDNSIEICKKYAHQDNRVKIIDKPNGGISDARNIGIQAATGQYIGFVDSDDFIENDMFELLYNLCIENNSDISMVSYKELLDDKIVKMSGDDEQTIIYDKLEFLKELLININIENYLWNKLFRRDLFENILFPVGENFEDLSTTIRICEHANKLVYRKSPKYNYVRRNNSIVHSYTYEGLKDYVKVTEDRYFYLLNKYPEIEVYNALAFISNMVIVYKHAVVHDIDLLYKDFEKNYNLFMELVEKYKTTIFSEIGTYKMLLLSIILWDANYGKDITKEFEKQRKLKTLEAAITEKNS